MKSFFDFGCYIDDQKKHDVFMEKGLNYKLFELQTNIQRISEIIRNIITIFSFLFVLYYFSPLLTLLVILGSTPYFYAEFLFAQKRFSTTFRSLFRERRVSYLSSLLTNPYSAKEIRLFGIGEYLLQLLLRTEKEVNEMKFNQEKEQYTWQLLLGILSKLFSICIFLIVITQTVSNNLTIGDVMLYMGAIGSIQGAFAGSASIMSRLQENVLYYYHYTDLIALPEIRKSNSKYQSIPNLEKGIEFQNVCFRYNIDQPWVLRNVNLLIPANKCLALVGTNGAGKTTLVKILTRLYEPSEGSILWDGVDIREFDPSEFRQRISIVFQDFMRYDLTAQENIGFGDINHLNNIELIRKAARRAGIDELLVKLPQGYQTVLSRWLVEKDKSVDLSGGEWQKVAIARMFMRQSSLFILDEPTASLDSISENEIYNHFIKIANAKTSLIISHRYSTVRRADMVALLDEGSIIEYGAPNLLIAEGKEYAKLFRSHVKKEISSCFEQKT